MNDEIIISLINLPFEEDKSVKIENGKIYYSETKLTDQYYIKNCYVADNGKLYNSGRHKVYVYGDIDEGKFISTCSLLGVGKEVANKDLAFAMTLESRRMKDSGKVGLVNVVLL